MAWTSKRILASALCLTGIGGAASATILNVPDQLGMTGGYNIRTEVGEVVENQPAIYLIGTIEFTNTSGTLASGALWNQIVMYNDTAERAAVGQQPSNATPTWAIFGGTVATTGIGIDIDTPTQVVLKVDQTTGSAYAWINPDLNQPEPLNADAEKLNFAPFTDPIDNIRIRGGQYGTPNTNEINFTNVAFYYGGDTPFGSTALPGDTDGDGDIDDADLGQSFANYTGPGGIGKTAAEGDTDGDGDVDDGDLGTSFAGYTGPLGPAVPEPASLALLGLGGLALARRHRA